MKKRQAGKVGPLLPLLGFKSDPYHWVVLRVQLELTLRRPTALEDTRTVLSQLPVHHLQKRLFVSYEVCV